MSSFSVFVGYLLVSSFASVPVSVSGSEHAQVINNDHPHPNIIFMLCDDCGFNDFGFNHNTETKTPFLDSLVLDEALLIDTHYVSKLCSPSRAAFLTGRYPSTLGLQHGILKQTTHYSLTRQVSTLSNEFQAQGYSTHAIGKWHLGFQAWEYTPTYRGFDTFDGFYNFEESYVTYVYNDYNDLRSGEKIVEIPDTEVEHTCSVDYQTHKAL
jgi:arylsulfatase A-like enzyme